MMITEEDAIRLIHERCHSTDREINGCSLDQILRDFLTANGFNRLAIEAHNVDCWGA